MAQVHTQDGLITAGERQIVIRPKVIPAVPKYPILYTHGAGARADANMDYGNASLRTALVADAGITGVSADFGGTQTWGNDTAMAAMTAAFNWLQTQPGVKPGKVALAGGSMGGLNALAWAAANPTKVTCVNAYIPVLNPSEIHDLNLTHQGTGYAQFVDQAYPPGWVTADRRATKDPLYMAGLGRYAGIPIRIHFGLQDGLCRPENAWAFRERVGTNVELFPITGGHEEATELQINRYVERDYILSKAV